MVGRSSERPAGGVRMTKREKLALWIFWGAVALSLRRRETAPAITYPGAKQYKPGSPEQIALFENAADTAGVARSWASDPDFITLLRRESNGWVGIPNYTYGSITKDRSKWPLIWEQLKAGIITTKSSATGLGQMTLPNTDAHYPAKRQGIGDAWNEAVGMLRYIKKRYGTPAAARKFHDEKGWY